MGFDPKIRSEIRAIAKKAIAEIKDEDIYLSPEYLKQLRIMSEVLLSGINEKVNVKVISDGKDGITGFTDGQNITFNWQSKVVSNFTTTEDRYIATNGLFYHEMAHVLYLDFEVDRIAFELMQQGKMFGANYGDAAYTEIEKLLRNKSYRRLLVYVYHTIGNCIADQHDEDLIMSDWGFFTKASIHKIRNSLFSEMIAYEEMLKMEMPKMNLFFNLTLQYARFHEIYMYDNALWKNDEVLKAFKKCIPDIENAVKCDNLSDRYSFMHRIVWAMWPLIESEIDDAIQQQQNQQKQNNGKSGKSDSNSGDSSDDTSQSSGNHSSSDSDNSSGAGDGSSSSGTSDNSDGRDDAESSESSGSSENSENPENPENPESSESSGNNGNNGNNGNFGNRSESSKSSDSHSSARDNASPEEISNAVNEVMGKLGASDITKNPGASPEPKNRPSSPISAENRANRVPIPQEDSNAESDDKEGDGDDSEDGHGNEVDSSSENESNDGTMNSSDNNSDGIENPGDEDGSEKSDGNDSDRDDGNIEQDDDAESAEEMQERMNQTKAEIAKNKAEKAMDKSLAEQVENDIKSCALSDIHEDIKIVAKKQDSATQPLLYETLSSELDPVVSRMVKQIENELKDLKQGQITKHRPFGRMFIANDAYRPDNKYFATKKLPTDIPEMAISVLVDCSGSMASKGRLTAAIKSALMLYKFATALDIPVSVNSHQVEFRGEVKFTCYSTFERTDAKKEESRICSMEASGCNRDGAALSIAAELLSHRPEPIKLLFIISDGRPNDYNYSLEVGAADIKAVISRFRRKGVEVIAAGIGDDTELLAPIYGSSFLDIADLEKLPKTFANIVRKRIMKYV